MSNYDRGESPAEIEQRIRETRKQNENWNKMYLKLCGLTSMSGINDRRFDTKLDDLRDFVQARMWETSV